MRYFETTGPARDKIKATLGLAHEHEAFASIPDALKLDRNLHLPAPLDEMSIKRLVMPHAAPPRFTSFLGAGLTPHFVPEWVSQQIMRAEWSTSYTPYQPEASQGTLQALFEYQSVVASLFGQPYANASMYDGATALAEGLLMAVRIKQKKAVAISSLIHPEYRETVRTYLEPAGIAIYQFDFNEHGQSSLNGLLKERDLNLAAVALQTPNFFARFENLESFKVVAEQHDALLVGVTTEPLALSLIKSMSRSGVDIMTGEGIGFLGAPNLGGPGLGLFACHSDFLRNMPGRLVGRTVDKHGSPGFVLTLSAREQHIRRERAFSNICTNHNLMALAFLMTLSAYGKTGFIDLARINLRKTLYLRKLLMERGIKIQFPGPHFNETIVALKPHQLQDAVTSARAAGMVLGLELSRFYPEFTGHLMISTTELHSDEDISRVANIIAGAHAND